MIRKWASSYFTPLLLLVPVAFLLLSGGKKQLDGRLVEEELLSDDLVLSLAEVGALLFTILGGVIPGCLFQEYFFFLFVLGGRATPNLPPVPLM